jgi:hypothetical protein
MSYLDCMCFHVSIHQVTHSSIYLDGILTANCYFSLSPVDLCYIHRLITASVRTLFHDRSTLILNMLDFLA